MTEADKLINNMDPEVIETLTKLKKVSMELHGLAGMFDIF